ncbi:MAG: hypothetical protein WEB59_11730 [Thermoanaerobaculia bacterium]
MKAITLRGLSPELGKLIVKRSAESGESLNRVVIAMLEQGAGLRRKPRPVLYHDLDRLAGSWSAEEAAELGRDLAEQRLVEAELWK